jgi:hypothetical protein
MHNEGTTMKTVTKPSDLITQVARSVNASSFGVCLTIDREDYLIWTVRDRKLISERLPMFCTSEERLKAHLSGFCANVGA